MAHIVIDIGHHKSDSGAVANGFREVDINYSVAMFLKDKLIARGVSVTITSGTLAERSRLCNQVKPDALISIHNNAGGGDGTEIYTYTNVDSKTTELAQAVYNKVVPSFNNGRGIKKADFHILRETVCPAILIEIAFLDSVDIQCIDEVHEQLEVSGLIAQGLCQWLGVNYQVENKPQPDKLYRVQVGAFKSKENASKLIDELKGKGYNCFIV